MLDLTERATLSVVSNDAPPLPRGEARLSVAVLGGAAFPKGRGKNVVSEDLD